MGEDLDDPIFKDGIPSLDQHYTSVNVAFPNPDHPNAVIYYPGFETSEEKTPLSLRTLKARGLTLVYIETTGGVGKDGKRKPGSIYQLAVPEHSGERWKLVGSKTPDMDMWLGDGENTRIKVGGEIEGGYTLNSQESTFTSSKIKRILAIKKDTPISGGLSPNNSDLMTQFQQRISQVV